jgi:hypothetical protein
VDDTALRLLRQPTCRCPSRGVCAGCQGDSASWRVDVLGASWAKASTTGDICGCRIPVEGVASSSNVFLGRKPDAYRTHDVTTFLKASH